MLSRKGAVSELPTMLPKNMIVPCKLILCVCFFPSVSTLERLELPVENFFWFINVCAFVSRYFKGTVLILKTRFGRRQKEIETEIWNERFCF